MLFLILSYSGHYPNKLVEVSETELENIYKVQGERYLCDTEEGRKLLEILKARAILTEEIIAYI